MCLLCTTRNFCAPTSERRTCVTSLYPEALTLCRSTREPHSLRGPASIKVAGARKRERSRRACLFASVIVCQYARARFWKRDRMSEKLEKKKTILLREKHVGWDSLFCFSILFWRCVITILLSAVPAKHPHYFGFGQTNWQLDALMLQQWLLCREQG